MLTCHSLNLNVTKVASALPGVFPAFSAGKTFRHCDHLEDEPSDVCACNDENEGGDR